MKPGELRRFGAGEYDRHGGCTFLVLEIYESASGVKQVKFLMNGIVEESWLFSYVVSHSHLLSPMQSDG